ncbi:MAG: tRNA (adenosine(37)-N6)-threonylcarbamoyltransferase complex dimerization subunit type 1 TsaB [candidate division Zixibacteria bacterium]|nr:tRNA (adenosine(37)-N6)-threonylcarbamoyltransferase complex dimerization subunit type 1 TsaB [candidate division Zixibacteria bacterium]
MLVLGIDSSTDKLAVGLADTETVIAEKMVTSAFEHASHIIALIDSLLMESSQAKTDLTGIAVAIGPGSFTGLRIGLAVAKGLCVSLGLPLIGLSTFEVIAHRLRGRFPEYFLGASARRGEYYLCRVKSNIILRDHIVVIAEEGLPEIIGSAPAGLIGREPSGLWGSIAHPIPPGDLAVSGGDLARLGARWLADSRRDDPATLEPLYIAPSQAERRFGQK